MTVRPNLLTALCTIEEIRLKCLNDGEKGATSSVASNLAGGTSNRRGDSSTVDEVDCGESKSYERSESH